MFRKFSHLFDTPSSHKEDQKSSGTHACEFHGCLDEGIYRAPKSRYHLESGINDWHWFCLIHIRDYNAKWNYYQNMSEAEIEEERRADVTWQRPTWPLGASSGPERISDIHANPSFQDPFGLFNDSPAFSKIGFPSHSPEGKALIVLGLSYPFTQNELRKHYLKLVKKHHPDTNGGTSEAVETLKCINEAYEVLKKIM
jgi:hypothetical protein